MLIPENMKIVTGIKPQSCGALTGRYVSLKNYGRMVAIIEVDNTPNATAQNFHLYAATDVAGDGVAANQTVNRWWLNADTSASDTLVRQASGSVFTADNAQKPHMIVLDIDPEDYPGYDCFAVQADASNPANSMSVTYVLYEPRYAQATPPSAIVD
jgi:hypothetical protein